VIEQLYRFGVALGIGLLIGLQREYAYAKKNQTEAQAGLFAGTRTFPLLGMIGWLAAFSADSLNSPFPFIAIILPTFLLIITAYHNTARHGEIGMTTEVAGLLTILIGAVCYWDHLQLALAIGVAVMVLLSLKIELHTIATHITQEDVVATLKFAVISAIILPILPDTPLGPSPLDVLNLRKVWLMVVFISGIGFAGYLLIKLVGARQGIGLSGLLGGLVSSTAVTLTFAQRSHRQPSLAKAFALAIMVSWTVMFGRVLVEVLVVNPALLRVVWMPITVAGLVGLIYGIYLYRGAESAEAEDIEVSNPFELTPAIQFAILYGVIIFAANAAQIYFGNAGLFLSSILSGLADVDAITLSMADLSRTGGSLDMRTAAQAIVLATMSNTVVKGGIVVFSGSASLRRAIGPGIALILVSAVSIAFLII
jgi:uncharacterized membrane protein (DUF4010 family)